jgi:hypothetical protein
MLSRLNPYPGIVPVKIPPMATNLEQRSLERVAQDFSATDQASVIEILGAWNGPERNRLIWDILELSKGDAQKIKHYLDAAHTDYRDILYWAEYYETDPLIRGRDPRKVDDEILARFGKKP